MRSDQGRLQPLGGGQVVERKTRYLVLSNSSVKQSIRGIDWCAERAAAPQRRRWKGFHDR